MHTSAFRSSPPTLPTFSSTEAYLSQEMNTSIWIFIKAEIVREIIVMTDNTHTMDGLNVTEEQKQSVRCINTNGQEGSEALGRRINTSKQWAMNR